MAAPMAGGRIGLIAGNGRFPFLVLDAARSLGIATSSDFRTRFDTYCASYRARWAEGKVPRMVATLMGLYSTPADEAIPAATLPTLVEPDPFGGYVSWPPLATALTVPQLPSIQQKAVPSVDTAPFTTPKANPSVVEV